MVCAGLVSVWGWPGGGFVDVNDLPAFGAFDEDTAFVVGAVGEPAIFVGAGEHEGVADDGRMAVDLQARLQKVVAIVAAGAGPGVVDHEEMEIKAVLAVGSDEPFVERQLVAGGGGVGLFVLGEDAVQMFVQEIPNLLFYFVIHHP